MSLSDLLIQFSSILYIHHMVCARGLSPTYQSISDVMNSLSRRWGHVASRMPAGQRSWRDIDVFGIASTQTRGFVFCGSHKLYEQLSRFDLMETLAVGIADLAFQTVYFGDLVRVINESGLPGYAVDGYWTVHLARVFVPDFSGVKLLQRVRYRPGCARLLQRMGDGANALVLLGVDEEDPYEDVLELCRIVKMLGRVHGYAVDMEPSHLVCAVCEAFGLVFQTCVYRCGVD